MTHPKSRSTSNAHLFLPLCFLCLLRLLFLSSVHRLMQELGSAFLLWVIYRSAGLGAVISHVILKRFMKSGMGTAALEEGAVSHKTVIS